MKTFSCITFLFLGIFSLTAGPVPMIESVPKRLRVDQPILELASSYQRKIVSPNTNFKYRVATQMLTLKSPAVLHGPLFGGTFAVRSTLTLLAESIYSGPETHYFGFAARPSLEWWPESEKYYFYFSPGGGVGTLDSRGVEGGQGQDFTLNILVDGGIGIFLNDQTALKLGVQYHHFSNGGQTEPNPGLNLLGPQLGVSVFF